MIVLMTRQDQSLLSSKTFKAYQTATILLLSYCYTGASLEAASPQTVDALVGDDVVLPCHLEIYTNGSQLVVEWSRDNLKPEFVHLRRNEKELLFQKNPLYTRRTVLFVEELNNANFSLLVYNVKRADSGRYKCLLPTLRKETFVDLHVSAVSVPLISLKTVNVCSRTVVLGCRSEGWFPKPELSWLDAKGAVLRAEAPMSLQGPDSLYSIDSTITVQSTKAGMVTCRTNLPQGIHSRDTHIYLPEIIHYFCNLVIITVVICTVVVGGAICAAIFAFWWFKKKIYMETLPSEGPPHC